MEQLLKFASHSAHRWSVLAVSFFAIPASMAAISDADYQPLALKELFGGSELVVLAKIIEVRDESFMVGDVSVLSGVSPDPPLEIRRFRNWAGNSRWTGYDVGQRVLLFLTHAQKTGLTSKAPWRIRGLGGEGEMPVENEAIYLHGMFLEGFPKESFNVQGGTLTGYRFDLSTFLAAFRGYHRCFRLQTETGKRKRIIIQQVCDDHELAAYREDSPLHRYLVETSLQG